MTTFKSILPNSSTTLERNLERTVDLGKFHDPLEELRRAKLDARDDYVPFLIWEYGLGELLPYLKDPKRAISEGILWQRLRGTPQSLVIAMSWIDFEAMIEQEETGQYFAEFMLDPGKVIRDPTVIPDVIAISELSAPARSRLSRIYHGYDVRRLKLSDGPGGQLNHHLLSDYSGVHSNGIRISFGETFNGEARLTDPDVEIRNFSGHADFRRAYLDDVFRTSVGWLDDTHHGPNPFIYHSHLFSYGNTEAVPENQTDLEERKYQHAQIVLSDSWEDSAKLSDHNGVIAPGWYDVFEGEELVLSENVQLSNQKNTFRRVTILHRDYVVHPGSLIVPAPSIDAGTESEHVHRARAEAEFALGHLRISEDKPSHVPVSIVSSLHWLDYQNTLQQTQTILPERKFCKAMVVLSDGGKLSDPNGVLNAYAETYHGEGLILSDRGELSERYEYVTREPVLCREVRDHNGEAEYVGDTFEAGKLVSRLSTQHVKLGDPYPRRLSEDRRDYGPFRSVQPNRSDVAEGYGLSLTTPKPSRVDGTGAGDDFEMRTLDQSRADYPFDERSGLSQGGRSASGFLGGAEFKGQHWIDINWPSDNTWQGINVVIASTHTTETME